MFKTRDRNANRVIRHARVRKKVSGTPKMPRLCVYRSLNNIYAQIIDDTTHKTLAYASTVGAKTTGTMTDKAVVIGTEIAKKAKSAKVKQVAFDRGSRLYHGRVKALADGAREGGLNF